MTKNTKTALKFACYAIAILAGLAIALTSIICALLEFGADKALETAERLNEPEPLTDTTVEPEPDISIILRGQTVRELRAMASDLQISIRENGKVLRKEELITRLAETI